MYKTPSRKRSQSESSETETESSETETESSEPATESSKTETESSETATESSETESNIRMKKLRKEIVEKLIEKALIVWENLLKNRYLDKYHEINPEFSKSKFDAFRRIETNEDRDLYRFIGQDISTERLFSLKKIGNQVYENEFDYNRRIREHLYIMFPGDEIKKIIGIEINDNIIEMLSKDHEFLHKIQNEFNEICKDGEPEKFIRPIIIL